MTHILIVEDEPRLRKDLVDFLVLSGFSAKGAATASEMRDALENEQPPAVIVLDVGLPDGDGFELAAEIRQSRACSIIILTAFGDSDDRVRGFDSGADIYLVKDSTLREVEAAIRSLLRRANSLPESAKQDTGLWMLNSAGWTLTAPNQQIIKLTATEFAFMKALCDRSGEIVQREGLAETLAGQRSNFDKRYLDAVVSRLRRKIESQAQLPAPIMVVYGVGYTFTGATTVG
ncbi:response regulator transcription factor [Brucella anthropi]|uniref:response regulator transcription factor n=1 Tax=Brucella anthropi TaxID=529 RepID=UPI0007750719|nr:response regulator transcription factor [Brucella anthropi]KXO73008.1 two-component system response regulator [Brucella anthropi]